MQRLNDALPADARLIAQRQHSCAHIAGVSAPALRRPLCVSPVCITYAVSIDKTGHFKAGLPVQRPYRAADFRFSIEQGGKLLFLTFRHGTHSGNQRQYGVQEQIFHRRSCVVFHLFKWDIEPFFAQPRYIQENHLFEIRPCSADRPFCTSSRLSMPVAVFLPSPEYNLCKLLYWHRRQSWLP